MFINEQTIEEILKDPSYIRTSGSDSERECAEYIANLCRMMELEPVIEPFPVRMYQEKKAVLTVDGKEIECKSWHGACTGKVSGELYVPAEFRSLCLKSVQRKNCVVYQKFQRYV